MSDYWLKEGWIKVFEYKISTYILLGEKNEDNIESFEVKKEISPTDLCMVFQTCFLCICEHKLLSAVVFSVFLVFCVVIRKILPTCIKILYFF